VSTYAGAEGASRFLGRLYRSDLEAVALKPRCGSGSGRERWALAGTVTVCRQCAARRDIAAAWSGLFTQLGAVLRQTLQPILGDRLKRIDHIGSTSVPGLAAKPIIDVMVSVVGLPIGPEPEEDFEYGASRPSGWWDDIVAGVETIGYKWSGAWCMDRRKLLFNHPEPWSGPLPNISSNLHIRCDGEFSQQAALLFRDQLRSDDSALKRYEDVKRELAQRNGPAARPNTPTTNPTSCGH
jgi:GrpB-like predicted nucleotidyltransferase (UPF0157 family)